MARKRKAEVLELLQLAVGVAFRTYSSVFASLLLVFVPQKGIFARDAYVARTTATAPRPPLSIAPPLGDPLHPPHSLPLRLTPGAPAFERRISRAWRSGGVACCCSTWPPARRFCWARRPPA